MRQTNAKRYRHEAHILKDGRFVVCLVEADRPHYDEIVAYRPTYKEAEDLAEHLNRVLDGVPRYDKENPNA